MLCCVLSIGSITSTFVVLSRWVDGLAEVFSEKLCKSTQKSCRLYRILPHFTDFYRILPIVTVSYRFLPIFTDSGVLLRSMGEEGTAKERQGSCVVWEAGKLRIEN